MSWRLRFLLIISLLCLSLTITGCGLQGLLGSKNKNSSNKKGGNQTVMAVSLDEQDPNKLLITKGINDLAKKENIKIKYITQSDTQTESPLKDAKILIYQGGNPSILQKSQADKIPVLALNQLPAGVKAEGIVTPDQEKAGELMAQALISKVTEGQIVILQSDSSGSGSQESFSGIKAVLSKYPKITVHNIVSTPGADSAAKQGLNDFLQKNPGKVQAVLAQTEKSAAQASEVLKQAQLDKKIVLIGGQASVPSLERMASGAQVGDIDTAPYLQGVNAFQWAQKIINKKPLEVDDSVTSDQGEIPAKIIQVKAVTPDNLALIQKSYVKTMQSAEQDANQKEQKDTQKSSQGKDQGKDQSDTKKDGGQSKDKQGSSGGAKQTQGSIPPGVEKVTERVKTETTRDYLDAQGNIIGTEKTTNDQVKTIPAEMLNQQQQQQQQQQSDQSKDSKKDQGGQSAQK